MRPPLLEVRDLSIAFAGIRALDGISFDVHPGEILGLIGPNGAGKSTLLNCASRLYKPDRGDVRFAGESLLAHPVHALPGLGIRRTFQNLELFHAASVRENVVLGAAFRHRASLVADLLDLPGARRRRAEAEAHADRLLVALGLAPLADRIVSTLPYGVQKAIELGRALASSPRLLLLDEPAAGLDPEETRALGARIRHLRDADGITVVLVEHDMRLVMSVCDRIVVIDHGRKLCEGPPVIVQRDPAVIAAYLGEETVDG